MLRCQKSRDDSGEINVDKAPERNAVEKKPWRSKSERRRSALIKDELGTARRRLDVYLCRSRFERNRRLPTGEGSQREGRGRRGVVVVVS